VAFELDGVEIDHCVSCGGTWLDAGELELIGELAGAKPGGLTEALQTAAVLRRDKRRCPRCGQKLGVIALDKGEGGEGKIEIDRCLGGHGLWLDRGELGQLMRATQLSSGAEAALVLEFLGETFEGKQREC